MILDKEMGNKLFELKKEDDYGKEYDVIPRCC